MMATASKQPKSAVFGTWKSPISAKMLSSEDLSLMEIAPGILKVESDDEYPHKAYYIEGRPAEDGRRCIVECSFLANAPPQLRDVLPQEYSSRTSVHGYGGGSFAQQYDKKLIFSDQKTHGVYSLDPQTQRVESILPGKDEFFYADFSAGDETLRPWILAIQEDHRSKPVVNSVVAIDVSSNAVHMIASGADFYSHPQFNVAPNGQTRVCWIQWNHPDMPWTGSQLFVALWHSATSKGGSPRIGEPIYIAGRPGIESIAQPKWNHSDGSLLFCSDRSGYWQLFRLEFDQTSPLSINLQGLEDGNFAGPEWFLGTSSFTILDGSTVAALWTKDAVQHLVLVNLQTSTYELRQEPSVDSGMPYLQRVSDQHFIFIGSTSEKPETLFSVASSPDSALVTVKPSSAPGIPPAYFSTLKPISFPRTYGADKEGLSYAMFMPPLNPEFVGPKGTLPPLLVSMHGGPTAQVGPGLNLAWQYWTTRGYAFAAVNYSGSSGYSRDYRGRLDGQWGIADVADAASCVEHLASAGLVDRTRVGIVGGSAGGYACLQALCSYPEVFAGGVSLYGISDVKALVQETHKFESRYADRLLFGAGSDISEGQREKIMHDWSPIHHANRIKAALLLLQGRDDKIVPPNQAERMIEVIKANDGDAKVVFFEGEGHGFVRADTIERATLEEEQWWLKTLVREDEVSASST